MKILHVTFGLPPYANGGLPLYVDHLATRQTAVGHSVIILEPGSLIPQKPTIKKVHNKTHTVYRVYPALPVANNFGVSEPEAYMTPINPSIYHNFLQKINPDIIHVHSIMGIHKDFFTTAKSLGIKLIMTTHDYYGIDLRANFVDSDGNIYLDRNPKKTANRNHGKGLSHKKQLILQTSFYKRIKNCNFLSIVRSKQRNKLKYRHSTQTLPPNIINAYTDLLEYYDEILAQIDFFIFNSSISSDIYKQFIPNIKGKIIHPTSQTHTEKYSKSITKKQNKIEKVIYIGRVEKYKGVDILVDAMQHFPQIQCFLYGDDYSKYETTNIHNMGTFCHKDIQKILSDADLLIMPSRYYETFAFPVLEALEAGIPVLVSSHVGAKDLVEGAPIQAIFEPTKENLYECMNNAQDEQKLKKYRAWIQDHQSSFISDQHDKNIEAVYHKVLSEPIQGSERN